jgi:endonuclease/exonuclease/phosphatase family metal-dependent hydrolase
MHKGYNIFGHSALEVLRNYIQKSEADIVLLQEIAGKMTEQQRLDHQSPALDQLEYLAGSIWPFAQYGKNAVFPSGHHGNAILSRYPILEWANFDISETLFEGRGLLMSCVEIEPGQFAWICNTHLSLFHRDRVKQFHRIAWHLKSVLNETTPIVLGGDFNDWNLALSPLFKDHLGMSEAFISTQGEEAKSFPSFYPKLKLDRLYFTGCECREAKVLQSPWHSVSDHLPLFAQFSMKTLLS